MTRGDGRSAGVFLVAATLAVSMGIALNMFSFAVLWDALHSENSGLSENATQILTGWGGGIIGIIGAVVGYNVGDHNAERREGSGVDSAPPSVQ